MNKWFIVKKEKDYLKEFLELFWEFHDFRIKKIIYDTEHYSVDVILEYDTPAEMDDVLLRFVAVTSMHVNCNIDYEADWIYGAGLCITDENNLLWYNDEDITDVEEVKKAKHVTYVESEEIRFALVDHEGKPLNFPETMLHQTWRNLNYDTMKYEEINKEFHVFEVESSE